MHLSLDYKRLSTAEVFAYSVLTLFPDTHLVGSELLDYGFSYTFVFPYPEIPAEMIEDRLLQVRVEDKLIESKTMMPANAAFYFEHNKQPLLAKKALESSSSLLDLIKIDETFLICNHPHIKSTKDILFFKILKTSYKERLFCIEVAAFENRDELKKFCKLYDNFSKKEASKLGLDLELFSSNGLFPRGVKMVSALNTITQRIYADQNFHEVFTRGDFLNFVKNLEVKKACQISSFEDRGFVRSLKSESKEVLLWVLQFIEKNIKLLCLESRVHLFLPQKKDHLTLLLQDKYDHFNPSDRIKVEFHFKDLLGRGYKGAFLEISFEEEEVFFDFSVYGRLESLARLLVEKYEGHLPFWLSPEHVAIIDAGRFSAEMAISLKEKLEKVGVRVFFDKTPGLLKNKIYLAQTRKIPYLCVIGDKEVQANRLSVKDVTKGNIFDITESDFVAHVVRKLEENFESQ
jgi:threonyl-tRNA synthetase